MRKSVFIIPVLAFALLTNAFGQKPSIKLTFTCNDYGLDVDLGAIDITNLTQGGDTTIYFPETVLTLNYQLGIENNASAGEHTFFVSQNYPNPFEGQTTIRVYLPEKDKVRLSALNLLGCELAFFEQTLTRGNHLFTFYPGNDKCYILSATCGDATRTIRMMAINGQPDSRCRIGYTGMDDAGISDKLKQGTSGFKFSLGDVLKFKGYPGQIAPPPEITDAPANDKTYVFLLHGAPCTGTPNVIYEGQNYSTLQLGNQCWFRENLNVGSMINGSSTQTNNGLIEKYCYENDPANCNVRYGGLYQWDEMMQYSTTQGVQGICPNGWHIPTDADWCTATQYIDPTVDCNIIGGVGTYIGTRMKSDYGWSGTGNGTNVSGFRGVPGGHHCLGYFYGIENVTNIWSSTEQSSDSAIFWGLFADYNCISHYYYEKYRGFSVRCIKN